MGVRNSEGYMDLVPYKAIANIDREKRAETKSTFRPLVYICAPFSGDVEENRKRAAEFAKFAYDNGCIPVTPHLLFPFMEDRNKEERALALHMDIVLMGKCKEDWVLAECITDGMRAEIAKAKSRRQTVKYFTNDFVEVEQL